MLLFHASHPCQGDHKDAHTAAHKQGADRAVVCLTDTDLPLSEERVHVVDICHELAVTKGEIGHISARLSSCQHLEQSWREKKPVLNLDSKSETESV